MAGRGHVAKSDGWKWPEGQQGWLAARLFAALRCNLPGWNIGITAEEHHPREHAEFCEHLDFDADGHVTLAEIFIFANYQRFRSLDLSRCLFVGPSVDDDGFQIPLDAISRIGRVDNHWSWSPIVDRLIRKARCPIIVSAGPIAKPLIHEYWRKCPEDKRQVIVDVGSATDEQVRGRRTRAYQKPGDARAEWRPKWKIDQTAPAP